MAQLSILNGSPVKLPGPELLHELLVPGRTATGEPVAHEKPALDYQAPDGGVRITLSYTHLHDLATIVAAEIGQIARQVQTRLHDTADTDPAAQFVVPVLIPQAPELYVAQLGILKAGGAFCPIQLDAPAERIRFILDDVHADLIITTTDMAARLPQDRPIRVVLVDELRLFDRLAADPTAHTEPSAFVPVKRPAPEDLAYCMYTSGSTGTPKGVGVPHVAATQSLLGHDRHIPAFDRFLQFAAPTFDVSVFEIFFPLYRGRTLVCANRGELLNDLPAVLRSMNVDACELTPTVAGSLLRTRANAPGLRLLLTIGEMLTEPVIREFGAAPGRPSILWGMYGPTEAAIHCTLEPAMDGTASVRNIGFPFDTVSAYILRIYDEEAGERMPPGDPELVPMGEVGELAVGGYQLASGYINRPEQTAAAFIDTVQFGKLYRTGDKARITPDGTLECSGRLAGGQVKLRGQRIELGEVEQAVLRADGVLGCAASVIGGMLVAFCDVGPAPAAGVAPADMERRIIDSCSSWLPRYMVPNDIVQMADFPRLASGKVDRKRIAADYAAAQEASKDAAAAAAAAADVATVVYKDDLDRDLHALARDVLGVALDTASVLAASGVDSLKAIQLAAAIRATLAPKASAVDVLESRTLGALYTRVQSLREADESDESAVSVLVEDMAVPGLDASDIALVAECNPVQTAMLAETMASPEAYCNWVELAFAGASTADVAAAFRALIANNDALRTGFAVLDGRFVQVVRKQATAAQVAIVDTLVRGFSLASEADLLAPFSVQIAADTDTADTADTHAILHVHHAVYDGWSMDLMRQHLSQLLQGTPIPPQLQYTSVVQHYRAMTAAQRNAAEKFWAQTLNGFQPTELPRLNERRPESAPILSQTVPLPGLTHALVEEAARAAGSSPQAVFQSALAWLWSKILGVPDIVLGTVTSGRTLPLDGIESVVGPCLQTVPVRTDLSRMRTVRDLLASTHTASRALLAHAFLPFADIKKTAGFRPGQPLYDALFVYQESLYSHATTATTGASVVEVAHQDYLETKLLWEVEPTGAGFQIRATYHSDAFPAAQLDVFARQYAAVLGYLVAHVDAPLDSVASSLTGPLLSTHNLEPRSYDGVADLALLVQRAVDATPDSPALCVASSLAADGALETLTFAELNTRANRIAAYLVGAGAQPGDTVAIIMEKSVGLYTGILGILKAGCAYLPLLPSIPAARAGLIIAQSGVRHCLTDTATLDRLVAGLDVAALDLTTADLSAYAATNLDVPADAARLAYVVYTSGSTGAPKGVCVPQRSICSNLDVLSRIYPVPARGGRMLQSCSIAFDVSVFEIFFAWVYGMCLCTAPNDVLFEDIERAVRLVGATHLSMTSTVASLVDPANTPSVEFIVTAGEPLTERVSDAWVDKLYQGYGPSETTNICTVRHMTAGIMDCHLGFGLENTSSFVLAEDGIDVVPIGCAGELCFGGDQVVQGYLGQPALTAERFIEHPQYGRLYRTGDIGRMLADGTLMFMERIDDQIKLRGQRIELGEIDILLREAGLLQAVTAPVRLADAGSDQLASFVVPSGLGLSETSAHTALVALTPDLETMVADLFRLLAARLPSYMVPSYLIPVAGVPLMPSSGKTNKRALTDFFSSLDEDTLAALSHATETADVDDDGAQWSDTEKVVAGVLAEALHADVQRIGRWTPLASLGLDSLTAIPVSRALSASLGQRIAISDILRNMSVAQLAQVAQVAQHSQVDTSPTATLDVFSPTFKAETTATFRQRGLVASKFLPCMPLQEAMLVSPVRGLSYVNRMLFALATSDVGAVQAVQAVRAAWQSMVARHEILRTCFATADHGAHPIAQVVLASYDAPWAEMRVGAGETVASLVERHVQTLANPVDACTPPVSFAVIRHGSAVHLSFVCHHAVYDGEAMGLLLSEVEAVVHGAALDAAPSFDSFLAQALVLPASTDAFWRAHLDGFRPALLVLDAAKPTDAGHDAIIATTTLGLPLSAIQSQANDLGVSLLTTVQSAWAVVLGVLADTDDVCFGNVYNGRSVAVDGVDRLVAPCFNTLPVRAPLSSVTSARALLHYFQALNPEMIQHQFTPLRAVQRQHLAGGRLFDSLLLLQQPAQVLDERIWALEEDDGEMDLPLVCELVPDVTGDALAVRLHAEPHILPAGGADVVLALLDTVVATLLQFASSQIPTRSSLPADLQASIASLGLTFARAALPEPEAPADKTVEVWSPTESAIRAVLAELSGVAKDAIRRDTSIYRLGLDSIRAVQVASVLRKGGLAVSAIDVMEHPSCTAMAAFVDRKSPAATASDASGSGPMTPTSSNDSPPLSPLSPTAPTAPTAPSMASSFPSLLPAFSTLDVAAFRAAVTPVLDKTGVHLAGEIEGVLPCTPLQAGLLHEFIKSSGRHYYNFIGFTASSTAITATAWKDAWLHAAATVPMLRTGFANIDAVESASAVSPYAMVQITPASMLANHVQVQIREEPFSVEQWRADAAAQAAANLQRPPWQVVLVERAASAEIQCHLAIHHALYDAASLQGILDIVAQHAAGVAESIESTEPATEAVVVDILAKVASLTMSSSAVAAAWKERAAPTVVNSFPVLTPLKVTERRFEVLTKTSAHGHAALQAAVTSAGFTMNAVVQAAWTRILSAYIGDAHVVFGAVMAGRSTEATQAALFPCISTLPVVAANVASNRALVEQLMATTLLLHKSQHVPLSQVQRWLGQPDTRLFDTLVVYQATATEGVARPWTVADEEAVVDYPLSLEAIPTPDGALTFQITADTSILPVEHARTLLDQIDAVVAHLALHPDGHEDDLAADLAADDARASLFSVLAPKFDTLPTDVALLHQFVEAQAAARPGKTALEFVTAFDDDDRPVSTTWSYAELNDRGNKVAALVAEHTQPGDIVGFCFDKCPEAFFAMLGIFKAGCAYLALDPTAPAARKAFILDDAGATLLLTEAARATAPVDDHGLLHIKDGVVVLAVEEGVLRAQPPPDMAAVLAGRRATVPGDVCYCLYTSGTTGTPKGCALTHENAVQGMRAFQELFRAHYDADAKWLQFASFHFDVAVLEQYWTWSVGVTLVGAPRDLILEDLAGTIARLGITHIDLTPSLGRMLDPADVPSLCRGVFITGGEPLKQEMLDPWGPTGAVHNFYGPTEATIGVTSYPQVPQNGRASNIGRQFANVGTRVFRPGTQTPVLRGAVGELCVSGKLVGAGYINRPELTAKSFPTLATGERIYRTGDLVRLMHDGCFDFLGRADDQVKLRGQRLEIGEINHAIRLGVGARIDDVCTLVIRDEANRKDFLVSFVVVASDAVYDAHDYTALAVLDDDDAALSRQVQAACRARLPGYMVPTYVVQLPFVPLSPNNKAEAKELKKLFNALTPEQRMRTTGGESSKSFKDRSALTSSATAATVLDVLCKLNFVGPDATLSPDTSLFELGVDSISVLRLARAFKTAGLAASTPSLVLGHPLVGDLVAALETLRASSLAGPVVEARLLVDACQHRNRALVCTALGVAPSDIEYIAPCSALQQGMISRSRSGPEHASTYYNAFTFVLEPGVEAAQVHAAWAAVVRAHAILRTRFVATSDGFVQAALKTVDLAMDELVLGESDDLEATQSARHAAWVAANQDDTVASPLEMYAVSQAGTTTIVVHIFHALYDAASLDLVLAQVAASAQVATGTTIMSDSPSFLEALTYGPLRNYANSRQFWDDHLSARVARPLVLGSSSSETVTAGSSSSETVTAARTVSFEALERLRGTLGVTHASLVQALWVSVLQKVYGTGATLGLVLSGRASDDLDGVDGVVGPLFNTLPFHARRTRGQSWSGLAQACHAFAAATLPFQQVPLRDIQKWCAAGQPLFDVLLSFQFAAAPTETPKLWTQSEPTAHADYPLALEATLNLDAATPTLQLLLVAKGSVADEAALARVLDDFEASLAAFAADPDAEIFGSSFDEDVADVREIRAPVEVVAAADTFDWTADARLLRREMASLASVPEDSIASTTTLLELGLDSVDTIKLSARLRKAGLRLSNSQLVRAQTIAVLAESAKSTTKSTTTTKTPDETPSIAGTSAALSAYLASTGHDLTFVETVLPPTPVQEAMVADMLQSGFAVYYNNDVLALADGTNLDKLKAAWSAVAAAYPILRTVFVPVDSPDFDVAYCQVVRSVSEDVVTDHEVPTEADVATVADVARSKAVAADGAGALFQLDFVHAADSGRHFLVLSLAHALYDGWSLDLLHQAVAAAYAAAYTEETVAPVAPVANATYTAQLEHIFASAGPQADAFWASFLDGAQPTYVCAADTVDTVDTVDTTTAKTVVRAESTSSVAAADLVEFCKRQSTSVQVVGQAAWAAVLASLTGSLDLLFGVVLSGRDADGAADLVFPTMNTVPVRVVLHGTAGELLQYMQANMSTIAAFQHYPLRKAQKHVARSGRSSGQSGIFNTLFILQKRAEAVEAVESDAIMTSVGGAADVEYPVCVEMELRGDAVVWRTACDSAIVSAHGAQRLLHQLDVALRFLVHGSAGSVLAFDDDGVSVCGLPPFAPVLLSADEVSVESVESVESWTDDELAIRAVLASVSGLDESAIRRTGQTLYHLGLDSISAIKVGALLKKEGLALGVRDMLGATSLADMATLAKRKTPVKTKTTTTTTTKTTTTELDAPIDVAAVLSAAGLDAADVDAVLPATATQTHLISVWQNTDGSVFFPAFRFRLTGQLAHGRRTVYAAWSQLVAECPILRTVFVAVDSPTVPIVQVVVKDDADRADWPVPANVAGRMAVLSVAADADADADQAAYALTLTIHHALYDAVSLQTIMARLEALCQAPSLALASTAAAVAPAWHQTVAVQVSAATKAANKAFWTAYLKGAPVSEPVSERAPTTLGRIAHFEAGAVKDVTGLKATAAQGGVSIQSLAFAVYAQTVAASSTTHDVVFGVYLANRDEHADTALSAYPTLALVPLLVRDAARRPAVDVAAQIQKDLHAIASVSASGAAPLSAALWEICAWTGVTVDAFVNFLLPADTDTNINTTKTVSLTVDTAHAVGIASVSPLAQPARFPALAANRVRAAYPDAIDVELALRRDQLDMGVFGAPARLGNADAAADLVARLASALQRV